MHQLQSIIRFATRQENAPLNVMCFPTHERYESGLAKTGNNFLSIVIPGGKDWVEEFAPIPKNYHLIHAPSLVQEVPLPAWFGAIDIFLSQVKPSQFEMCLQAAVNLQVPHIHLEHTLPGGMYKDMPLKHRRQVKTDVNVFVNEYQRDMWGHTEETSFVNHTGIDLEVFKPDPTVEKGAPLRGKPNQQYILSVCNDWIARDEACGFTLWRTITGFPQPGGLPVKAVGDTPGFSKAAPTIPDLVIEYNRATVFLNTTLISSLPTTILEAMACGVPVVSTATCGIDKTIIKHGVNGFVSNDPAELRNYCIQLLTDEKLAKEIGEAGRKTIEQHFSLERFVAKWKEIFNTAITGHKL